MQFVALSIPGVYLIEQSPHYDERGEFARLFCREQFLEHGLDPEVVQINRSLSLEKGTLRGFHYQIEPFAETKTISCIRGRILDVIVDLRPGSENFGKHLNVELAEGDKKMLYIPKNFAHSFLTLEANTAVSYLVSKAYSPRHERGIRWNDPYFEITWPIQNPIVSAKDEQWPNFKPE